MFSRLAILIGAGLIAIAAGFFGMGLVRDQSTAPVTVTCRPSHPAVLAAHDDTPMVLAFGNSLIFDHGWQIAGYQVVNCARQGLLAQDAQPLVGALPQITPEAILLGFGSVEAVLAKRSASQLDPSPFAAATGRMLGDIHARWPDAQIFLASVPAWQPTAAVPAALRLQDAATLNMILTDLAAAQPFVTYFDLGDLAAIEPDAPILGSYDGVHLTPLVYQQWQTALRTALR